MQYKEDIVKLETILASQKEQKELFLADIKNLSMKSGILPPIYHKSNYKKNLNEYKHKSELNKFATDTGKNNFLLKG